MRRYRGAGSGDVVPQCAAVGVRRLRRMDGRIMATRSARGDATHARVADDPPQPSDTTTSDALGLLSAH